MKKIAENRLPELFQALSAERKFYLPLEEGGVVGYGLYSPEKKTALTAPSTVKSPKELFFPQVEGVVNFQMQGKNIDILPIEMPKEDFVVMGVRACDARSFDVLDRVFLSDPVDGYYAARREHGTIVSLACDQPQNSCFCEAFGIDAAAPAGDVRCFIREGVLYWQALTDKGQALTDSLSGLLEEAGPAGQEQQEAFAAETKEKLQALPYHGLDLSAFTPDRLGELFHDPKWKKLSQACLGCGSCTFVCPTCQCYDVRDFDTGHGIQRYRCWDSCMYSDFTMMAHGTPRPTQLEKFRQRFMHKLVYFPSNNEGMYSCVGCGRCVRKCPIHMHIVKVIKALGGKKDE